MRNTSNALRQVPVVLCLLLMALGACKQKTQQAATADVNPAFEQKPPEASEITISLLDKPTDAGNVLLTARLDKKVVTGKFHAIMAGDEKKVLHDDGMGGDEKADDGIFSIITKEDTSQLRKDIVEKQLLNRKMLAERKTLFKFVNRSAVPIMESVREFNSKNFTAERKFKIDADALLTFTPDPQITDHSLMITNISTVQDLTRTFNPCTSAGNPNGVWTFGKLLANMANTPATGVSFVDFARAWLNKWLSAQVVNGDNVASRLQFFQAVIKPWLIKSNSGTPPANITLGNWTTFDIKPQFAPFRLLAIVNRLDLRGNSGYTVTNAGEGRFVFGLVNTNANCVPLAAPGKMTVIFEYGIPKKSCSALKAYAKQWMDLKTLPLGSVAYNQALQLVTDQFSAAGADPARANGSCINQVRTNELALNTFPWELREFTLNAATHLFVENTVAMEPNTKYNRLANPTATAANQKILAEFANTNSIAILANAYSVPLTLTTSSGPVVQFRGAKGQTESPDHIWDGSLAPGPGFITDGNVRHIISLNTCDGCHGGEAKTDGLGRAAFLHIDPQPFGTPAVLSAFLTGNTATGGFFEIPDPVGRPVGLAPRKFNDLERRNIDLQTLVSRPCKGTVLDIVSVLKFKPVNMPH